MKKIILLLAGIFVLTGFVQLRADDHRNTLSPKQIEKIRQLKQEASIKFREIGRSNISGYEKGQRKKEVSLELKNSIQNVLTKDQIGQIQLKYGSLDRDQGLKDIIKDEYDKLLTLLEKNYEEEKDRLENSNLSEDECKYELKKLKRKYKQEKQHLKDERDECC